MNLSIREKWTAGSGGRKESGEDVISNNGGSGRDNSAVMVAMVCGMVLSSILLVILLAMVCWEWYAHCLAYYFSDKFSLSLSVSLHSRSYVRSPCFSHSSPVTSSTTCKSMHLS